jgi:NitT/TauT family transport system substrate-binding protein
MRRAHTATLAAVCAIWLAACGREPIAPLRVGTLPGPTSELFFLAQHRGWLPPSEYRLVEFINDGEVMRAFRNGSIEAAFVSVDEVLMLAQSEMDPVILFVTAESRGGDAIVAHPDVTSLADLRGRRVAVQVNSVSAYLLRRSLKTAGLDIDDLQIVNLPPERHRAAYLRRDVDAVVTVEPVRAQIAGLGGVELFSSASLPLELMGVVIINGRYLEPHGARASAMCTAWRRAEAEMASSAEARTWVAARMQLTVDALDAMLEVVRLVTPSESDALLGPPRPRLMATAARIHSVLLEAGLLAEPLSLEPIFRWPIGVDPAACRG